MRLGEAFHDDAEPDQKGDEGHDLGRGMCRAIVSCHFVNSVVAGRSIESRMH